MTKEKLLFYENHLNQENKFRNIIEFEDLYNIKWINYLCNSNELTNLFLDKFYDENNKRNTILEFRKYLIKEKSRCKMPSTQQIKKIIRENNYIMLQEIMQELFLEVVDIYYIKLFVNDVNKGLDVNEFLELYKNNPTLRFCRVLLINIK